MWAAGMGLAALANPLLAGVGNYLAPATAHRFVAGGLTGLLALIRRAMLLVSLVMLPLLAAAVLWGGVLVEMVYGAGYAGTGSLVALLMAHLWMTALALPVSRAFFALERADLEMRANLVGLVVLAAAGGWLAPAYGAQGVAMALVIAGVASNVARGATLRRLLRRSVL